MSFVRARDLTRSFNIKLPVCGYILTRRRLGVFTWASFLGEWMIFHGSSSSFTADRRLTSALPPPISKMDHWHSTYNLIINLPTHLQGPLSFPFLLHPPSLHRVSFGAVSMVLPSTKWKEQTYENVGGFFKFKAFNQSRQASSSFGGAFKS